MRWTSPCLGQERSLRKFAWLPMECSNGVTVWLEMYTLVQRFGVGRSGLGWLLVGRFAD